MKVQQVSARITDHSCWHAMTANDNACFFGAAAAALAFVLNQMSE